MLNCGDCHGTFQAGGVSTTDPVGRWCAYDLRPLRSGQNNRGADTFLPHVAAIIGNERRFAPTPIRLPFAIDGWVDDGGLEIGREGAEDRITTYYREARDLYVASNITFVFTQPSGAIWTSVGHIEDLILDEEDAGIWDGDLELLLLQPWEIT